MTTKFYGGMFDSGAPWGRNEKRVIDSLIKRIDVVYPQGNNLLVSLTWFGPQFPNTYYKNLLDSKKTVDRIFWLAMVDPLCLPIEELKNIESVLNVKQAFYLGSFDSSPEQFNFFAFASRDNIPNYDETALLLTNLEYVYLCYNRKPKPHRIRLVESIFENNLNQFGILTLGKNDQTYNVEENLQSSRHISLNENEADYAIPGKFQIRPEFGIPYDAYTLGNIEIWQRHFLNIVSETEFRNWDNLFVTEKIFKPIAGLRPFVINGQTKMYQWLTDQGFKTFNHYWPQINFTSRTELEIHKPIVTLLKHLTALPKKELMDMYQDMLPSLRHNRARFLEYADEQQSKIHNLC